MFKQALAVGKLVSPDSDHTAVADGLAEAQFGQGKVHEAQKTLKSCGMMQNSAAMPTSYLRWLNKSSNGATDA